MVKLKFLYMIINVLKMATNIYVLRLVGGHFYVGKSDDVAKRYQQHLDGKGSSWTKKHKPIALERTIKNASVFDEDKITKEYMSRYGIDKVRGGSYVEAQLSDFQVETLKTEIWGAKDLCKICGRAGHFAKTCRAKTDVSGNKIEYEEVPVVAARGGKAAAGGGGKAAAGACYRCGRKGHYSPECYAGRHVDGSYLSDGEYEDDDSDDY
jgi:predicted GIY-YIG superfamily endonuclease